MDNAELMEGKPYQQLWPIYKIMSAEVKSRNFRQCKLLHQRMLFHHGSIAGIVYYYRGNEKVNALAKQYTSKLSTSDVYAEPQKQHAEERALECVGENKADCFATGTSYAPDQEPLG
jgi:hypothetical protein